MMACQAWSSMISIMKQSLLAIIKYDINIDLTVQLNQLKVKYIWSIKLRQTWGFLAMPCTKVFPDSFRHIPTQLSTIKQYAQKWCADGDTIFLITLNLFKQSLIKFLESNRYFSLTEYYFFPGVSI